MADDRWRDDDRQGWGEDRGYRSGSSRSDYGQGRYGERERSHYGRGYGSDLGRDPDRFSQSQDYGRQGHGGGYSSGYSGDYGRGYDRDQTRGYGYGRDQNYSSYGQGSSDYGRSSSGYGQSSSDYGRGYSDYGQGYAGYGQSYSGFGQGRDDDRQRGYGGGDWRGGLDSDRNWWDRTRDQFRAWGGDDDARRRREQDEMQENRGRGPRGYTRSDERIREDVSDRLSDDWRVDASEIEVKVDGGEVTLSGTVNSRDDKRRAEDIAEQCSGVKHVQNNLRVQDRRSGGAYAGSSGTSASTSSATGASVGGSGMTASPNAVRDVTGG